jgi:hypothetical protein
MLLLGAQATVRAMTFLQRSRALCRLLYDKWRHTPNTTDTVCNGRAHQHIRLLRRDIHCRQPPQAHLQARMSNVAQECASLLHHHVVSCDHQYGNSEMARDGRTDPPPVMN